MVYDFDDVIDSYDYEPDNADMKKQAIILLENDYGKLGNVREVLNDFGFFEKVFEYYKDELKTIFEDEAHEKCLEELKEERQIQHEYWQDIYNGLKD